GHVARRSARHALVADEVLLAALTHATLAAAGLTLAEARLGVAGRPVGAHGDAAAAGAVGDRCARRQRRHRRRAEHGVRAARGAAEREQRRERDQRLEQGGHAPIVTRYFFCPPPPPVTARPMSASSPSA